MKRKSAIKALTLLLSAILILSSTVNVMGAAASKTANNSIKAGKAATYLLKAADDYNKKISRKDLLKGMKAKNKLTRIQGIIMVSRAFGTLPKPKGNNLRLSDKNVKFTDVPKSGKAAVRNLIRGGILVNTKSGKLRPKTLMSEQELKTLVRRIYTLYGTNLKDDFYASVNKNALDHKKIPPGETEGGGTADLNQKVNQQVQELIMEIVNGSGYQKGSMEQRIKDFYNSAVNVERRNALGAKPLKKYLEAIDRAENLQELTQSQILSVREINSGGLFSVMYMTDYRDTQNMIMMVGSLFEPSMSKEAYEDLQNKERKAYVKLNTTLLKLSGETAKTAKKQIDELLALEKQALKYIPKDSDYADTSKMNEIVSIAELQKLMPEIDVKGLIEAGGNKIPAEINIQSPRLFKGIAKLLQKKENLNALKTVLKLNILTENYLNLSDAFRAAFNEYNQQIMGEEPDDSSAEEVAGALVTDALGDDIDRLYVEKFFSKEVKEDLEKLVKQFIEVYKERIEKLDWMSETTKKKAVEKLDGMKFIIGYPDRWSNRLEQLTITDDYFENQVSVSKLASKRFREMAEGKIDTAGEIGMPLTMVNAYYDQYTNTMAFPAAILQAPNYDVNASLEENLGGIGTVFAHEISHAFDNTGAKYDKDGLEVNWWTKEDYAAFQKLCDQTVEFYNGYESAPGIKISGKRTLGENIADIGAVACALEVLKKTDNPDYDKFFVSYAQSWLKVTTRAYLKGLQQADEHSPSNLRVNRVLSNFDEFYQTYKIKAGDGMYVPKGQRIKIW
ncbi:M13 family metallopeptidase [Emergencia timonensis]|uniref:M13 family metallopeptidase n=1 Tax=Emergencia timonensis TaxID=1776384 RepID=UPI0024A988B0|nr:M13 family metallopeptidase [Emergencia timonensis]